MAGFVVVCFCFFHRLEKAEVVKRIDEGGPLDKEHLGTSFGHPKR